MNKTIIALQIWENESWGYSSGYWQRPREYDTIDEAKKRLAELIRHGFINPKYHKYRILEMKVIEEHPNEQTLDPTEV